MVALTLGLTIYKVPSMKETTFPYRSDGSEDPDVLLAAADAAKGRIRSDTPKEWKVFVLWGIWVLVFVPPFDFVDGRIWGPIVWSASLAGGVATMAYFVLRARRLHWARQTTWRNWLAVFVVYVLIMVMAGVLQGHFRFAWTAAAVLAAIPFFVTGLVVRTREERDVAP
jgi:hypothetical protein